MMCHRMGRPPTSTSTLGIASVYSRSRMPRPPQRMTVCMLQPHVVAMTDFAQDARRLHVRLSLAEGLAEVGLLDRPGEILLDHLQLGNPRLPTQRPQLRDVGEDVAGVADAGRAGKP